MRIKIQITTILFIMTTTYHCSSANQDPGVSSCVKRSLAVESGGKSPDFDYPNQETLSGKDFIVMTRNLYVGGDVAQLLVIKDKPLDEIVQSVETLFETIANSQFTRRARAIAREIKMTNPDVINLQEVALVKTGPVDFTSNFKTNADCTEFDFLEDVKEALEEQGLSYEVAIEAKNLDIELTDLKSDIRLIDRDVILVKSGLTYHNPQQTFFTNYRSISLPEIFSGAPDLEVKRSYSSIDITKDSQTIRVFNTHLEVTDPIQGQQGAELIAAMNEAATQGIAVLLAGDINSDPDLSDTLTFATIRDQATMVDSWRTLYEDTQGSTCCYNEGLEDGNLRTRVDHILVRSSDNRTLTPSAAVITQLDETEQITTSDNRNLWPSDHAGLVVAISFGNDGLQDREEEEVRDSQDLASQGVFLRQAF